MFSIDTDDITDDDINALVEQFAMLIRGRPMRLVSPALSGVIAAFVWSIFPKEAHARVLDALVTDIEDVLEDFGDAA